MESTHKKQLNNYLATFTSGDHLLRKITRYHMESGGKQLRGMMAIDEAIHLGVPLERAIPWAAACELLHNATLVHDDIQDQDPLRRGKESVWKKHGLAQAINAGDLLLCQAYRTLTDPAVAECCSQLVTCLSDCAEELVWGQAQELDLTENPKGDLWAQYLDIARLKTGSLLQATVQGIHLLAGKSVEQSRADTNSWQLIGLIYQINDDINDFLGQKQEEQNQKDLVEKRINSLVAFLSQAPEYSQTVQRYCQSALGSNEHISSLPDLCEAIVEFKVPEKLFEQSCLYHAQFDKDINSPAKGRVFDYITSCHQLSELQTTP